MKKIAIFFMIFLTAASASIAQDFGNDYTNIDQKKSAIKMELFSPLTGNLTFGYEKYLKNWIALEGKLGIIGVGVDEENRDANGVFIKVGPKFRLKPDFITPDLRGSHFLRGSYIRPELAVSVYQQNKRDEMDNFIESERETNTSVAFLINFGKQYVLGDIMTLDWSFGVGYGFSSDRDGEYHFSHVNGGSDFPLAISAGFTIGFLLK